MKILQLDEEALAKGFTLKVTPGSRITVGRKPESSFLRPATMHLVLPFPCVSTNHAEIEYRSDLCTVTDRDSTNGTAVNGEKIHHTGVNDGDRITFANEYEVTLRITDRFDDDDNDAADPLLPIEIDQQLSGLMEAFAADTTMWSNANKQEYRCFTCQTKVDPESQACSRCLRALGPIDGHGPMPVTMLYQGIKLLRCGVRWDRCFYEAVRENSNRLYLVEMRRLHTRDLPEERLLRTDCQLIDLRHPNMFRLFTWFFYPCPGWKYGEYYVRIIEHSKAVNANALLFRFGPFHWRSAVSIILEALKPIIHSMERDYDLLCSTFQTSQLWLIDLGDGRHGLKIDSHQRHLFGWAGPERLLADADEFWQPLRRRADYDVVKEFPQIEIIVRVASALYEMVTGKCPAHLNQQGMETELDIQSIAQPQLAALIQECLGDPRQAPKTLYELKDRLTEIDQLI